MAAPPRCRASRLATVVSAALLCGALLILWARGPTAAAVRLTATHPRTTRSDERGYHEMIVHVPLCRKGASKHPKKRALIIGGGDGGAAREILRHDDISLVRGRETPSGHCHVHRCRASVVVVPSRPDRFGHPCDTPTRLGAQPRRYVCGLFI